ncbi:MAG TPA: DUF1841 family protein [Gammaproteobacteria bacterium]|nr:DUF1841 family protein [Gammaproteobacteria bacterium]
MFTQDRGQLRQFYFDVWRKKRLGKPLEPMERLVAEVIEQHPEYHKLFENPDAAIERDYLPEMGESNPFLHMGMHIGLHEQIASNRPQGIGDIHRKLVVKTGDPHGAEHQMMECLAEALWQAQRENRMPDETAYLGALRRLIIS